MTEEHNEGGNEEAVAASDMDALRRECDEYLAGWKRAKADYENLRKEAEKEKEAFRQFANEQFLLRMLPAIDQFEVAMQFTPSFEQIPEQDRRAFENWLLGLEAVRSLWQTAAQELGLEYIRTTGSLDPSLHEALESVQSSDIQEGDIVRAVSNGYILHGKVIRPAKVVVSSGSDHTKES